MRWTLKRGEEKGQAVGERDKIGLLAAKRSEKGRLTITRSEGSWTVVERGAKNRVVDKSRECGRFEIVPSECGQSTVEAAFAVPILFVLVLLLVQPALLLYDRMVMQSAAAEACRLLATSTSTQGDMTAACEAFVRHRLSCVPSHECFHVHEGGCTWNIQLEGGESSQQTVVRISTEVRPLPLFDMAARLAGAANGRGNITVRAEARASSQPNWAFGTAAGADPSAWVGAWLE